MTETILKIKTKLELPDEFSVFSYNYDNYGDAARWYFSWSNADSSKNVNVTCDDEAHILDLNYYSNDNKSSVPGITAKELQPTAEKLLARVFPEAVGHVVLKDTGCQYYRSAYYFRFVRSENGIEMPDNYVVLQVGYADGELLGLNSNWNYTSKVPSADKLIGADAAKEKIGKKLEMQLYYYVTSDENGKDKVFLAYTPSMSYIAADAKSGKLYTKKDYWAGDPEAANDMDMNDEAKSMDNGGRGYVAQLSDAEVKRIEELKNLISSDDAVKIIRNNKYLLIDENMTEVISNLREHDGKYTWVITLRDNRPVDYEKDDTYRAYARASVDAADGKILSFYASTKSMYDYSQEDIAGVKFGFSKKQCRNIFEEFAKSIESEKFANVKLSSTNADMSVINDNTGKRIDYAYAFNYTRYNEEVPFVSNGISGSVDRVTGKVYNYSVNWTDAQIPSAKDVIGAEKAFDAYMGYEGFDLVYEIVNKHEDNGSIYGYGNEQIIRLVYRTQISPAFVDAFTGKQLNYNGEEYEKVRTDYKYTDIEGTKYEKAITILAELGIGLPGEKFDPDKKITKDELVQMVWNLPFIGYRNNDEEKKSAKSISRQDAAKVMIGALGLDLVAKLDVYKISYKDASDIGKGCEGYIALAGGLGLFDDVVSEKFAPKKALTRGEAAQILLNTAAVAASGRN